jgi:Na+:H+ antiporter, NhaA family
MASLMRSLHAGRTFVAERFIRPAQEFVTTEALGGLALLLATAAALTWANSPWKDQYSDLWATRFDFHSSLVSMHLDLRAVVNQGLMTVFFFVVGLEIKRELLHGELSSLRKATLPIAAAFGGMIVPALIYAAINAGGEGARGWGIPQATDIAFALGALALLGRRVPFSLKVFVLALAIVDDLGAIAVIAVFYTDSISPTAVVWAVLIVGAVVAMARFGVRSISLYVVAGALLWVAMYKTGLHATLAGIALAAVTPARPYLDQKGFEANALDLVMRHRRARDAGDPEATADAVRQLERLARDTEAPLERLGQLLHPWTGFIVVPLFALANAGVELNSALVSDATHSSITAGVVLGLVLGKPAGIFVVSWLSVRLGMASLPDNVSFGHILGAGVLCGIGFTVSLFVTGLAFADAALVDEAKVGVLTASVAAAVAGYIYLWIAPGEPDVEVSPVPVV